jgi:hypothetical protein
MRGWQRLRSFARANRRRLLYIGTMSSEHANLEVRNPRASSAGLVALLFSAALLIGAATAAWVSYGPQIFMTFANSALAWCF